MIGGLLFIGSSINKVKDVLHLFTLRYIIVKFCGHKFIPTKSRTLDLSLCQPKFLII